MVKYLGIASGLAAGMIISSLSLAAPLVGVYTSRNTNDRRGANLQETILTPANVNTRTFGLLFTRPTNYNVRAQVLYVPTVTIPSLGVHNVIYTATENGTVYAFDADDPSPSASAPLWQVSLLPTGPNVSALLGVRGTPVIDPVSGTLYADCCSQESGHIIHRIHALDITTGAEKFGGPVQVAASVPGTGQGSVNGVMPFVENEQQRPGLLLLNGVVYVAYGALYEGTGIPYSGWIIGFDASTLAVVCAFCVAPNGLAGGIWQGGGGISADENGFIYAVTGNGTFDADTGGGDYGDSFLKLWRDNTGQLKVFDYATPSNQADLDAQDLDLGGGAPVLLPEDPTTHIRLVIGTGKDGILYMADRNNMGHYSTTGGPDFPFLQKVTLNASSMSTPTFFNGTVYTATLYGIPQAFTLKNGFFDPVPSSLAPTAYGYPGASGSISANGTTNGILWMLDPINTDGFGGPGVLRAYDATNIATELYNSSILPTRDFPGLGLHFTVPTIANGKVYTPMARGVAVFGLLPVTYGDANGDGVVDYSDAVAAMSVVAGFTKSTDIRAMDVAISPSGALGPGDGVVNLQDVVQLIRYLHVS